MKKIIWFLWFQGKEHAPEVVKLCFESWVKMNPDWEFIFLDDKNLKQYVDIDFILNKDHKFLPQTKADIIRVHLLKKYGGVWADATCYCQKPLNFWIEDHLVSGFFAFSNPGSDRLLSTWFLVAKPENELIDILYNNINSFFSDNNYLTPQSYSVRRVFKWLMLKRLLLKKPSLWFSFLFTKLIKVFPYFWMHYLFGKLYEENNVFKKIWDQTPKLPARARIALKHYGLNNSITVELKLKIEEEELLVFKLTHKFEVDKENDNSIFNYLKNRSLQNFGDA